MTPSVVVDTDVFSYLYKGDTRAAAPGPTPALQRRPVNHRVFRDRGMQAVDSGLLPPALERPALKFGDGSEGEMWVGANQVLDIRGSPPRSASTATPRSAG